jgi:hypothetical protein
MNLNGLSEKHIQRLGNLKKYCKMQVLYMPVCRGVVRLCLAYLITIKRQNQFWEIFPNTKPFFPIPFFVTNPNYIVRNPFKFILGDRSMVGHMVLVHAIGVRLPVPQQT